MVGLEGSLKITEPLYGGVGGVLKDYRTTEPYYGGVGRVLKDHRAMELSLCWRGPLES